MEKISKNSNTETYKTVEEEHLVKPLDQNTNMQKYIKNTTLVVYIILISLGAITGYFLSGKKTTSSLNNQTETINTDKVVGISDQKTFKDSTEGKLEKGGIDGEGTHKLIRDGGPSQTVYLISSVVDLDEFIGKDVKVWGQTYSAEKAGWLMDVGKVEIK